MEERPSYSTYVYDKPKKSGNMLRFIIILLVIIGIGGFGVYSFWGKENKQSIEVTPVVPTPTDFVFPTEALTVTLAPSVTATPSAKKTPTPTVSSKDTKTGLDRALLNIQILNGSGVVGAATKMSEILKELGYNISSAGNADTFDYENLTIQVKSTVGTYLPLLKSDLSSSYTIGSTSATLSASSSADAVVIIGK